MIITKVPFRISFFGGGTDYQLFFKKHSGSVISTTIDKYVYTNVRRCPPYFAYHTQIKYAKTESVRKTEELEHPLVRNCMLYTGMHNLSVIYDADLPARSGLGSSSSFAVGLLQAIYAIQGKYVSKEQLAKDAIHVERELCAESGGWQDQIAAAYGGFNRINFNTSGFNVQPVIISRAKKDDLQNHLLMFFTGISRNSDRIANSQVVAIESNLKVLLEMKSLVDDAERILTSQTDISEFGRLLDYAWKLKCGITNEITSDFINGLYKNAINAGALGGKLLGAGGGGFMILFAEPDRHKAIKNAFSNLVQVPIVFEEDGARVLYYAPDTYPERPGE